jgi:hypothetical protein
MTTSALDRIGTQDSPARLADRIGQATAVEQARAVAEVQAAIVVAQQCPRDLVTAREQMLESCSQPALAERAFFRYSRGGSQISGPSVHLAREIARCFGNVQYGISELRRDDEHGQSEMQAWAWDVQTNTRASTTFIVPHGRDTQKGRKALVDLRDIYENNANNGARRLREQIFAIIPAWFTEEAKDRCQKTMEDGGGEPIAQRVAKAIDAYSGIDITEKQLEQRVGKTKGKWDARDLAQLIVIFRSVDRGEVKKEDEFPSERVTAGEITGEKKPATVAPPADIDALWKDVIAAAADVSAQLDVEQDFPAWSNGTMTESATVEQLTAYLADLRGRGKT